MKDRDDIEKRYDQYLCHELPGQPMVTHMGTMYLMHDLHTALVETEAERDRLREALIAQAKKTAYYNGADPDAKAANIGYTYRWEEYLCDEAIAAIQEAGDETNNGCSTD